MNNNELNIRKYFPETAEEELEKILNEFIKKVKEKLWIFLRSFIWWRSEIKVEFSSSKEEEDTFSFRPDNSTIYIPLSYLKEYLEKNWSDDFENIDSDRFLIFAMFHEASHFRDMLMEIELDWKKSMLRTLKRISEERIPVENGEIPIWESIHTLYNCIDDIVVNKEVEWFNTWVEKEEIIEIYKKRLFASYVEKEWWSYEFVENEWYKNVWEWNWNWEINMDENIDYSKIQLSDQLPYSLLRSAMVEDQKIILDPKIMKLFFKDNYEELMHTWKENKNYRKPVKESLRSLKEEMTKYIEELKESWDEKILKRIEMFEVVYNEHIQKINRNILAFKNSEEALFKAIQRTKSRAVNKHNISLIDLSHFFYYSKWYWDEHRLDIMPGERYEIIESTFEIIQKWLILMDLLKSDIKNKKGGGKWKKEKGNWEEWSWSSNDEELHESPSLENRIKELEWMIKKQQSEEDFKESIRSQREEAEKALQEIKEKELEAKWIENPNLTLEIHNHIISKYSNLITSLVRHIKDQLVNIERSEDIVDYYAKKWNIDYAKIFWEISKNPTWTWIWSKELFTKKELIEKLKEEFKKMDFYILLDISWSMDIFKWKNWMLNIISTVLFNSLKQIEQVIQSEFEIYDYKIPVNFVLYWDWEVYSTLDKDLEDQEIIMDMIDKSMRLSWWTDDKTAWKRIANYFSEKKLNNEDYIQEIKEWDKIPFFLQIADLDVSGDWVDMLREVFANTMWMEVSKAIPMKRLILWTKTPHTEEEYRKKVEEWLSWKNWQVEFLDWKKIYNEVWVSSIREIKSEVKRVFDNLLLQIIKTTSV